MTVSRAVAIYRRELAYFYSSIVAYIVTMVFALLAGYFFYNLLAFFNLASIQVMQNPIAAQQLSLTESVLQPLFANMSVVLLLIVPMITMRLLSEERKMGTSELLFSYPISDWDAILGKYFAAVTVLAGMIAITFVYPLLLRRYAAPEWDRSSPGTRVSCSSEWRTRRWGFSSRPSARTRSSRASSRSAYRSSSSSSGGSFHLCPRARPG